MKKLINLLLALVFGGTTPVFAAHELLYAVTVRNDLVSFYSDAPGAILSAHAITGLQGIEKIRGLDSWNGTLYGIGSYSHLYMIARSTGAATLVGSGQFSPLLNGLAFGVDNGPSGMVIVSDLRQNLTVDRSTGVASLGPSLTYAAGDPFFGVNPAVTGLAYDSTTGIWYAADSLENTVASFNPTTGVLHRSHGY
jgi:hypothetical protein